MNSGYETTIMGATEKRVVHCPSCAGELKLVERIVTHERRRGRRAGRPPSTQMVWTHVAQPQKKTKARKS